MTLIRFYLIIVSILIQPYPLSTPLSAEENQIKPEQIQWQTVVVEPENRIAVGQWPGNDFPGFRTETIFHTTMSRMIRLIRDVEAYREWMPDCDESSLLARPENDALIYYISMKSPWPLQDRDWVNRLDINRNDADGTVSVHYQAVDGFLPEKAGKVRVRRHFALWRLTPLSDDRIHSVWYAHSDPGGWIPAWIIRYASERMIIETTRRMRQRLEETHETGETP